MSERQMSDIGGEAEGPVDDHQHVPTLSESCVDLFMPHGADG